LDDDVFIMPYGSYSVTSVEIVKMYDVIVVNLDVFSSNETHDSWPLAPKYSGQRISRFVLAWCRSHMRFCGHSLVSKFHTQIGT